MAECLRDDAGLHLCQFTGKVVALVAVHREGLVFLEVLSQDIGRQVELIPVVQQEVADGQQCLAVVNRHSDTRTCPQPEDVVATVQLTGKEALAFQSVKERTYRGTVPVPVFRQLGDGACELSILKWRGGSFVDALAAFGLFSHPVNQVAEGINLCEAVAVLRPQVMEKPCVTSHTVEFVILVIHVESFYVGVSLPVIGRRLKASSVQSG